MRAIWNGQVIAEAPNEALIYIERNWYFPPSSLKVPIKSAQDPHGSQGPEAPEAVNLRPSPTPYTCPWKGECQYFDVCSGEKCSHDTAWTYPNPKPSAIDIVKKDFSNHIAFWRDVEVTE
jgi:uncharacterized protein (DUF427 family)